MSHQHLQQQDHHVLPSGGIALSPTSSSQMAAAGSVRTGQYGNQVVHVRGDSDSDLEALFSVLHSIDGRPPASSFKNRKLPASFFRPPDHKATMSGGGGQTAHGRSVSSPAQLHHGGGNQQVAHGKPTGSAGVDGFINELANGSGVSGNWETSKNCPRYYLTPEVGIWQQQEIQQQQQQHGPMSGLYQNRAGAATAAGNGTMQSHQHSSSSSADFAHQDPLPHGWEEGITPDGEIYFINHVEKTTSWYDPRIPRHSRPSLTSVRGGPHSMLAHNSHTQQQQQHSHLSPKPQHQQCQMVTHPQMLSNGRSAHSEHFICLELQKLQKEKERLLHEQEAISCREMMLNELVRQSSTCGGVGDGGHIKCGGSSVHAQQQQQQQPEGALAMIQTMQSLYGSLMSTGGDSFTVPVEPHARQNSTDSGLGGMGTAYSLPRSPDDYLSNVDEMDVQEDVPHMRKSTNSCYLRMTSGNADLGHLSSVGADMIDDVTVMDGDQLLSSLAGDVTSDLLSEMDVQKIDNMLYL